MDIFERMRQGELIHTNDPEYHKIYDAIMRAFRITGKLNATYHDAQQTRNVMSELVGHPLDESVWIIPPFYTDFGQFTSFGKNVFVNLGCTFMDRGGITLEDDVLIGPHVKLITENHAAEPDLRQNVYSRPIVIKCKAWLGAGVTVLPGITIGENAIIGAGSVVTKNVANNTIVAGIPAKFIKNI